ncbi:hypothetical protein FB451DRAFT_1391867 [Mycena latifolia]|nr:hypothetical protein FB451DRAFT_1391867 [Mycena latifolia]
MYGAPPGYPPPHAHYAYRPPDVRGYGGRYAQGYPPPPIGRGYAGYPVLSAPPHAHDTHCGGGSAGGVGMRASGTGTARTGSGGASPAGVSARGTASASLGRHRRGVGDDIDAV